MHRFPLAPASIPARPSLWLSTGAHRAALAVGVVLAVGLALVLALPGEAGASRIEVGAPSPRDFEAPHALQYVSQVLTDAERDKTAAAVSPIYTIDPGIGGRQLERAQAVLSNLTLLRASPESADSKRRWVRGFPELERLGETAVDLVIGAGPDGRLGAAEWAGTVDEVRRVIALAMRQNILEEELTGLRRGLVNVVDPQMSGEEARLVADLAAGFVVANRVVDEAATEARREKARAATVPVEERYLAGRTIVREGDIITPAQYEALAEFGLLPGAFSWRQALADLLQAAALVGVVAALLARWRPWILERPRPLALAALLVLVFTAGARPLLAGGPSLIYAYPASAVAMTVGVLLGLEIGVLTAVLLACSIGLLDGAGIDMMLYFLLSGLAGTLVLDRIQRLKAFLVAGSAVAIAGLAVALGSQLADPQVGGLALTETATVALAQAALATGLAAVGVLAAGSLFGVTTSFQLLELMRPDAPLLRELQVKAPGTYQHSVLLSNLAEAAASRIGADPLLVRAGAYYHDIGKTLRPAFFVENQLGGVSPHADLDPRMSARIIIEHVSAGERMALEHQLPDVIIDFIREHHGTTRVAYFLHQAIEQYGEDAVDPAEFRYAGPRPQSRETAILMLADGSEAAVRARNPRTNAEIDTVVAKIIQDRLYGGQLEDSDLTLRDLRRIRRTFVETLQSMYHPRIQYPDGVHPAAPSEEEPEDDRAHADPEDPTAELAVEPVLESPAKTGSMSARGHA
ncbi:MAG: HDIG domain-containing protein [Caldilineae bacterium]|nr:HDIG domain-containing protein [Chloroflexota bacterium]MCB9176191.1 HDIG domain-containing protein [Caldilineae bacterium]